MLPGTGWPQDSTAICGCWPQFSCRDVLVCSIHTDTGLEIGKYGLSSLGTNKRRGGGVDVSGESWGEEEVKACPMSCDQPGSGTESKGERVGHSYAITNKGDRDNLILKHRKA